MTKYFLISIYSLVMFSMFSFSQLPIFDYEKQWKKVTQFEKDRLPQSALSVVEEIYNHAVKEGNKVQKIKSIFYKSKYTLQLNENGFAQSVLLFEKEIASESGYAKNILLSAQASLYHNYLQHNLYQINQRTHIEGLKDDPENWSVTNFVQFISSAFLNSIEEPKENEGNIEEYKELLSNFDKDYKPYLPTLQDVLVSRALRFFTHTNSYLAKPSYEFVINDPSFFSDHETFANHQFSTKDTTSLLYIAIKVFQDHLKGLSPSSIAGAERNLNRLDLVYRQGTFNQKDEAYLSALENLEKQYKDLPQYTEVLYRLAQFYFNQGAQESQRNEFPESWKKALMYCQKAMDHDKDAYGTGQCISIYNRILAKELNLQTEKYYSTSENGLARLDFKNINKVYFSLFPLSENDFDQFNRLNGKDRVGYFKNRKSDRRWSEELPLNENFYPQSVELSLGNINKGKWAVVLSDNDNFSKSGSISSVVFFDISDIAYAYSCLNNKASIIVVDRVSGKPLSRAKISGYANHFNADKRENSRKLVFQGTTNEHGHFSIPDETSHQFQLRITHNDDTYYSSNWHYNRNHGSYNQQSQNTVVFTDRSIYRPGQHVHFKTLSLRYDQEGIPSVRANEEVQLEFRDANGQIVGSRLDLKSNEFGSASGSFVAPSGGLLGQMSIRVLNDGSAQYVRIEEYKRPKFQVKIEPSDSSYVLGDSVEIPVEAISFSGANLDGAKMTFDIKRNAYFPYYRRGRYAQFYPNRFSSPMHISDGEILLDDEGKAIIRFKAIGDEKVKSSWNAVYNYTVNVSVTDINGETQSTQYTIAIGQKSRTVNLALDQNNSIEKVDSISININDLNGNKKEGEGTIQVFSLFDKQQVFNKRYWQIPDKSLLTPEAYIQQHPWYSADENAIEDWPINKMIEEIKYNSKLKKSVTLESLKKAGSYKIVVTLKEGKGDDIIHEQFVTTYDKRLNNFPSTIPLFYELNQERFEPGDNVQLHLGSPYNDLQIYYSIERDQKLSKAEWINIKDTKVINAKVEEGDRGGFFIHLMYFKNNRFAIERIHVEVPWSNKELIISYETYRDKVAPGESEVFKLKISGNKKDLVAAELLAGMYDASLDKFLPHTWNQNFYRNQFSQYHPQVSGFQATHSQGFYNLRYQNIRWKYQQKLNPSYQFMGEEYRHFYYGDDVVLEEVEMRSATFSSTEGQPRRMMQKSAGGEMDESANFADADAVRISDDTVPPPINKESDKETAPPSIRKNLKETVFFYPDLKTDKEGNVILQFKMNEALTKWKLMTFAHTKDLQFAFDQRELITQKEIMVFPNLPRFVRDNDRIRLQAKISNLTDSVLTGHASITLLDAVTGEQINTELGITEQSKPFSINGQKSTVASWWIDIPERKWDAITVRITAVSGSYSDGEENIVPILTNKVLVTESMPITAKPGVNRFDFKRFTDRSSTSLIDQGYTLEFTSNPAWYAVQALPYIMESSHKNVEQIVNRFYANSLASHISSKHPKIKSVFDAWSRTESDALISQLEKNTELKSALLSETPWVINSLDETQQKKNIALLFDLNKMSSEKENLLQQLKTRLNPDGGYSWYPGGRSNRFMSQYVLESLGHLQKLGAIDLASSNTAWIASLWAFVDDEMNKEYQNIKSIDEDHLSQLAAHYLYTRSLYLDQGLSNAHQKMFDYYIDQAKKYGLQKSIYTNGLLTIALQRFGHKDAATKIYKSLLERSLTHSELGRYWNDGLGYNWHELPIERHALLIEMAYEMDASSELLSELKLWLLRNKQTNNWKTSKATASAIYALLIEGEKTDVTPWLLEESTVTIKVGNESLDEKDKELGTGYIKKTWNAESIDKSLGQIEVVNNNKHIGWGAAYWTYFEEMDKVTSFQETPLKLEKKVFKIVQTDQGEELIEIESSSTLKVGEKVRVRILLQSDRTMEYIHLKDLRASGLEPISTLSGYKYAHGLYYYQSPGDLATDFFIDRLWKGKYVFEYDLRVQHAGSMTNGITTIQSMYAPDFTSHSKGKRLEIVE